MQKTAFLGLGTMGQPMALNLVNAGLDLMVWNRAAEKAAPLQEAGAKVAATAQDAIAWADTVVMMLSGPEAVEATLGEAVRMDQAGLAGKTVVNMGTNPPAYGNELAARLDRIGAGFVDAPVLGQKPVAEKGALLVLASGPAEAIERLGPVFSALGDKVVNCGQAPKASMMKLALNLVMIASLQGLCEGVHFAQKGGLDLQTFFNILQAGPAGSSLTAMKAPKLLAGDYSPQASLATGHEVLRHIVETADELGAKVPGSLATLEQVASALDLGLGQEDACALVKAYDAAD